MIMVILKRPVGSVEELLLNFSMRCYIHLLGERKVKTYLVISSIATRKRERSKFRLG